MTNIRKHHVAAGSYFAGDAQPMLLQAFLGTCVGLAIYDEHNQVGGIIHLLLPEPVTTGSVAQPEKYASTGVPLFLDALIDAGADKSGMTACLAGGALVGPVNNQDLNLDIGGRTAETVREILAGEHIDIAQSETGGFFTCCLGLNLTNGHCTIEPAGFSKLNDAVDIKMPSPAEIKQAMDTLKPIPQVALKVLRIIDEGNYDIEKISREVRKDQVISAKTLQLCNSAMFAKQREIESLDHALVFLGQDMLVKLVISAAVQSFFSQSAMGYSLCKGGIYHHAIGTATVAENLARSSGRVEPARAYTAGLLHDIGKVVLDQYIASAYPLFYRKVRDEKDTVLAIERKILGIDHTEVGRILAEQWDFPESLCQVIRYHHYPEKVKKDSDLALIVYLADLLLSRFHTGLELERVDTTKLESRMAAIGFSADRFEDLVELIPSGVFETLTDDTAN